MNVSVLGCGRWGSFLAWYAHQLGNKVVVFGKSDAETFVELSKNGKNEYVTLDKSIELTSDINTAVRDASVIIISISSQNLRSFLSEFVHLLKPDQSVVLCMKGIEESSGKRLSEVAVECGIDKNNLAVWVGPGHIQDFVKKIPNCMVIDSQNSKLTKRLVDIFKSNLIRFYYGSDLIGTEVGAAAKNVLGIVAGMMDGLNLSTLKGALMARGSREVARLIKAMGGNEFSAYGLCHLGDYETTLFSSFSNNRRFGEMFVRGESFSKLAEGVTTARAISRLGEKYKVDLPITNILLDILDNRIAPLAAIEKLFERSNKQEF